VFYQGFSCVEAVLALMAQGLRTGSERFVLLSGADYPIKNQDHIRGVFAASPCEYLGYWTFRDRPNWRFRVEQYHYLDSFFTNKVVGRSWSRSLYYYVRRYGNKLLPNRRFCEGMEPYGGPEWWMLTRECVSYVVAFAEANAKVVNFFRYTRSPSEMFIPTVVMNSAFSASVYGNHLRGTSPFFPAHDIKPDCFNFRHIDWSLGGSSPKTLTMHDFADIEASCALFARKFHPDHSRELLDKIDQEIHGSPAPKKDPLLNAEALR